MMVGCLLVVLDVIMACNFNFFFVYMSSFV